MRKLIYILLLLPFISIAQTANGTETKGNAFRSLNPQTVSDVNFLTTMGTDGTQGKVSPVNVNIPYSPVNYSVSNQTIGQHLTGIDTRLGQISSTTAGITQRVYFTADNTTVNAVTYFATSLSGKGSTATGSPPALVLGDNTKSFFTKDLISIAQPSNTIGYAGTYSGQLTVSASPAPAQQRFTVEIYRTNNLGVPIASGVSGAPTGDLGVTVIATLDSGLINLTTGAITNVPVSGILTQNITINTGERLRYHVSAAKIGAGGGNVTFGVYYGSSYNSYYDVPVAITTDAVLNKSTVIGITDTDALNLLNKNSNVIDVYLIAGQSNALGSSTDPSGSPTVKSGTGFQYYLGTITPVTNNAGAGNGGAWPAFINELYNKNQRKILVVPTAVGGTSQTAAAASGNGTWDVSGTLFSNSVTQVNQAIAAASVAGYTPVFKGVLWCQGENDAGALFAGTITKQDYYDAFLLMINNYRVQFGGTMPFYIFRTGGQPANAGFIPIRASQDEIADLQPYTYMVYRNALTFFARGLMRADNIHYTQAGYNEMGAMGADGVFSLDKYSQVTNQYKQIGIGLREPQTALDISGDRTISTDGLPKLYGSSNGVGLNGAVNESDQVNASATKFASRIPVYDFNSSLGTNGTEYEDLFNIRHRGTPTVDAVKRSIAINMHLSNQTSAAEAAKNGGFELRSTASFASVPDLFWFVGNKEHGRFGNDGSFSMGLNNNAAFNYYNNYTNAANNERVSLTYSGGRFSLLAAQSGTGIQNEFSIGTPNRQVIFNNLGTGTNGYFVEYSSGSGANNQKFIGIIPSISSTSGANRVFNISPVINQSSTAGYSALAIYPTETTIGSGIKNIIDLGVGSTQILSLQSNGIFNVGGVNGLTFSTSTNRLNLGTIPPTGVGTLGLFREGSGDISGRTVYDATASDARFLHLSGNETFTGIKSANNTGVVQDTGISLTNSSASSTSYVLYANTTGSGNASYFATNSTGSALRTFTSGLGSGSENLTAGSGSANTNTSSSTGFANYNISNGSGDASVSLATSSGNAVVGNVSTSGTGYTFVGKNNGVITYFVDKIGYPTATGYKIPSGNSTQFLTADGNTAIILSGSATLNFPSTPGQTSSELTITVTGAADGDCVSLGVGNSAAVSNGAYSCRVSAVNTVTVKFNNYGLLAIDPPSGTFKVRVFK